MSVSSDDTGQTCYENVNTYGFWMFKFLELGSCLIIDNKWQTKIENSIFSDIYPKYSEILTQTRPPGLAPDPFFIFFSLFFFSFSFFFFRGHKACIAYRIFFYFSPLARKPKVTWSWIKEKPYYRSPKIARSPLDYLVMFLKIII